MPDLPQEVLDHVEKIRQLRLNQRKFTYEEVEAQFRRNLEQRRSASNPCAWSNGLENSDDFLDPGKPVLENLRLPATEPIPRTGKSIGSATISTPAES